MGQKIELWSHCAPAKSPKIVKNRQKRQEIAQWDRKLNFGPTVQRPKVQKLSKTGKKDKKMHSGTEKVGKLNFGPTVHRTVHRVVVLLS